MGQSQRPGSVRTSSREGVPVGLFVMHGGIIRNNLSFGIVLVHTVAMGASERAWVSWGRSYAGLAVEAEGSTRLLEYARHSARLEEEGDRAPDRRAREHRWLREPETKLAQEAGPFSVRVCPFQFGWRVHT